MTCGCHSHNGFRVGKRSPEGLAQRELSLPGVDAMQLSVSLDNTVSVSGLELERDLYGHHWQTSIDDQYRRFHSGS